MSDPAIPADVLKAAARDSEGNQWAPDIQREIARAILAERSRCAKFVETHAVTKARNVDDVIVPRRYPSIASVALAAAIRAGAA